MHFPIHQWLLVVNENPGQGVAANVFIFVKHFDIRCSPVTLRTLDLLIRPNCKIKHKQINTYNEMFGDPSKQNP